MRPAHAVLHVLLLGALPAVAQERPREEEIFGSPPAAKEQPAQPDGEAPSDRPDEDAIFGGAAQDPAPKTESGGAAGERTTRAEGRIRDGFETGEADPDDPLRIGGTFYMRSFVQAAERARLRDARFSAPSLMDGYFDARPNDQLRGMLVARLSYDPTLGPGGTSSLPGLPAVSPPPNPSVGIDQLWLRFDIARTLFVTVGKQHARWGVGRLWAPTDYLTPQRRDPLSPMDLRLGASMLKLHLPWEAQGWNFYAVGLFDSAFATAGQTTAGGSGLFNPGAGTQPPAADVGVLGGLGGATRAEVVIGKTELGADAVVQPGRKPRYGLDVSSALGPFDVYLDVGFRQGTDRDLYRFRSDPPADAYFPDRVEAFRPGGTVVQATGGASYTLVLNDDDILNLGGEYFFNSIGYEDPALYPWLILNGGFQPFYTGKHYGALVATLLAPGSWDKVTFNLSTIGNLSDMSFVTRLDFFIRVLRHLQVEAFAAVHYGNRGGEFRFGIDLPPQQLGPDRYLPEIHLPAPLFDVGLALRMSL